MITIKVSVVIPTYNDSPIACLRALAAQSVSREMYEVIVVDNASDKRDIKKIVDKFKSAKYIREPRKGVYFARNSGWRAAKGDIIAFTDDDCEVFTEYQNDAIHSLGKQHLPLAKTAHRFYNPLDLYDYNYEIFPRGYPYEERGRKKDYNYSKKVKKADYLSMYDQLTKSLDSLKKEYPYALRAYLIPTVKKMKLWVKALKLKDFKI